MSPLNKKIEEDFKTAMKARDASYSTLSFLRAALKQVEVDTRKELTDEDVVAILKREIKRRKEATEAYGKGGRQDLVDKETSEMKILERYLPAQMSEEELNEIVLEVISEMGAAGDSSKIGPVTGKVMTKVKGKADGATVSKLVKEALTKTS